MGRWILHGGWYPDRKVRLYNRTKAQWVGEFVHETVRVEGSVGHLDANLLHFTCEIALRTPANPGPLHDARGRGAGFPQDEDRAEQPHPRIRRGRSCRSTSCNAAFSTVWRELTIAHMARSTLSEICESPQHGVRMMRVLHLDSGMAMRGGQWQVLRLAVGAREGGAPR